MSKSKGGGSTKNGRDSRGRRLGVKVFAGEIAWPGRIIVRQRGTRIHPGRNVGLGRDHTIFATATGVVAFERRRNRLFVSVLPDGA